MATTATVAGRLVVHGCTNTATATATKTLTATNCSMRGNEAAADADVVVVAETTPQTTSAPTIINPDEFSSYFRSGAKLLPGKSHWQQSARGRTRRNLGGRVRTTKV